MKVQKLQLNILGLDRIRSIRLLINLIMILTELSHQLGWEAFCLSARSGGNSDNQWFPASLPCLFCLLCINIEWHIVTAQLNLNSTSTRVGVTT